MTLIFSIHYFLWYGALTSIFGYESVYARQYTNATTMQYGYLNMVLPFMTVIVTPLVCSSADRRQSHRSYFTLSLVIAFISMVAYALLPLILNTPSSKLAADKQLRLGPWIYFCLTSLACDLAMGVNTCLSDSFAVLQAEESGSSFGRVIVWGTFGWASSALVLSLINQSTLLPSLLPGLLFGSLLLTIDVLVVSFWRKSSDFKLDLIPLDAALTVTGSATSTHREPSDYLPLNESARINLGQEFDWTEGKVLRRTLSPVDLVQVDGRGKLPSSPANAGTSTGSACAQPQGQRASPVEAKSKSSLRFSTQMRLLLLIMRRRKALVRYFVLFILSGFFMSMQWNYFFLYLEETYYTKFTLISALSMVGQSILGELPFFILSRKVIDSLGRSHTLSVSIISIGLRFLIYAYVLPVGGMYCIVLADCLQGPNYGLFYVVMTEVGMEFSYCDDATIELLASSGELDRTDERQVDLVRLSLRSTVQSVAFACYEGIGVGLGSLVGGWLVAEYGFVALWQSMSFGSISLGALNILLELLCPEQEPEAERSARFEFADAARRGTLKKVASLGPLPPLSKQGAGQDQPARQPLAAVVARKAAGPLVAPAVD